jgi:hypothetical protein
MTIYHKHHIIPKHMGGTDDPSNLVQLTVEEHAEAHRKLFEEHGLWQDEIAWKGLSGMIDHAEVISQVISKSNKGRKHSEQTRKKISESHKGKKISEKTIAALDRSGKLHSKKTKQKISDIAKEKRFGKSLPKLYGEANPSKKIENRKKISDRMKGNKYTKGKKKSLEHKMKIGLANKKRWEERRNRGCSSGG